MATFADIMERVHIMSDLILSDMSCDNTDHTEQSLEFSKHVQALKHWFAHISWANKKRFVLGLLEDVGSVWTLSLLLKSIWNCRPKDAVMSVCESRIWSSYDQVPMDNNRTVVPLTALTEVMRSDRKWFQTLQHEHQALVLLDLLTMAGGPIIWETLKRAQRVYEKHFEQQLKDLLECQLVTEPPLVKKIVTAETNPVKKDPTPRRKSSAPGQDIDIEKQPTIPGQGLKELETNLILWASTVKAMKDSMKLEEMEMTYKDGTKRTLWKVNRPKLEVVETVDFIQLLPSVISKRILMHLLPTQLGDCARVNKYWAYLVDEIRAEMLVRQKIDIELQKLRENLLCHDLKRQSEWRTVTSLDTISPSTKQTKKRHSFLAGHKSGVASLRTTMNKQGTRSRVATKPILNMMDFNERLERRGAADENIWKWSKNVLKINKKCNQGKIPIERGGLPTKAPATCPCPMLSKSVKIPLDFPLVLDPTHKVSMKCRANVRNLEESNVPK